MTAPTTTSILRGRTLTFLRAPESREDAASFRFETDGALVIRAGAIIATGEFSKVARAHPDADVIDHRPHLILPGFIDPHLHFTQMPQRSRRALRQTDGAE